MVQRVHGVGDEAGGDRAPEQAGRRGLEALGEVMLAASRRLRGHPAPGDAWLLGAPCDAVLERHRQDDSLSGRQPRQSGFYPPVLAIADRPATVAALSSIFESEIEARVVEVVDLLNRPAGEFTPRVRVVLTEFAQAIERRLSDFEDESTEPTAAAARRKITRPMVLPPPLPPQARQRKQ